MNIQNISNHIEFNGIFDSCRDKNGKINWYKVASYEFLPDGLIEKYFNQLKGFYSFYSHQKLSEEFIERHFDSLSLPALVKTQILTEDLIRRHLDVIIKKRLLGNILLLDPLTLDFLIDIIEYIKNDENVKKAFQYSNMISNSSKETINHLLNMS